MNTQFTPYGDIVEHFEKYEDIEDWFLEVKLIDKRIKIDSTNKQIYFTEIINYRTLLRENLKKYLDSNAEIDDILEITNDILIKSHVHPQLVCNNNIFELQYMPTKSEHNSLITKIAIEVIKLFNSKEFQYLKNCHNHKCSLFFIDTSKNHSRRWCSMEICGNRSKVNSFSKRKKDSFKQDK